MVDGSGTSHLRSSEMHFFGTTGTTPAIGGTACEARPKSRQQLPSIALSSSQHHVLQHEVRVPLSGGEDGSARAACAACDGVVVTFPARTISRISCLLRSSGCVSCVSCVSCVAALAVFRQRGVKSPALLPKTALRCGLDSRSPAGVPPKQ